jgi:hypothetical protein
MPKCSTLNVVSNAVSFRIDGIEKFFDIHEKWSKSTNVQKAL